jgi:hypothetical protein
MHNRLDDRKGVVNQNDYDPSAEFIEGWVEIRMAQGWTREAAIAELNLTAEAQTALRD